MQSTIKILKKNFNNYIQSTTLINPKNPNQLLTKNKS